MSETILRRRLLKRTTTVAKRALPFFSWLFQRSPGSVLPPFVPGPSDRCGIVDPRSGLYVHREVELRVDDRRLMRPPQDAIGGAVPTLSAQHYAPGMVASAGIRMRKIERRGGDLVWTEITQLSRDDLEGWTAIGASICWDLDRGVSLPDVVEVFTFPRPEVAHLDRWSRWVEADGRRPGTFAWHAGPYGPTAEVAAKPEHPFRMRFRLVLSSRRCP
jgi:hypothetical protein